MATENNAQAITFVIPGDRVDAGATRGGGPAAASEPGTTRTRVRLSTRRDAQQHPQRLQAVPGQDLVQLELLDGPTLTLSPETARALLMGQTAAQRSRSADGTVSATMPEEVKVNAVLRWQGLEEALPGSSLGATRGGARRGVLGKVVLKAFELVRGPAAQLATQKLIELIDGQVAPGVYRLQPDSLPVLKQAQHLKVQGEIARAAAQPAEAGKPLLVLVHGTFSTTQGTFGKLWEHNRPVVDALFKTYGHDGIYALEHPTLGESPIANARALLQALPAGARLHLLTHSRGGLVAEVLACAAAGGVPTDAELQPLFDDKGAAYAQQRAELQALAAAVQAKGIRVDRVVRVACPARGTLLAGGRLDAYLSVLKWTLELARVPVAPQLLAFLQAVARQRTDPAMLPGLAAMISGAPLLEWINSRPEALPGELRVLAGDLQGDTLGSWLKTLLADAFYWTDNDIVVQTRSMYGGAPRAGGALFHLARGRDVTHFAYFGNPRTAQQVLAGLTQAQPPGYGRIGPLSWAGQDSGGQRGAAALLSDGQRQPDRPAVFVLPGILGSHLAEGDQRIWLAWRLLGGLQRLAYSAQAPGRIRPDGAIGLSYDALEKFLAQSHEVVEFSYDWRRPLQDEARRLAAALAAALDARDASGQPVRIVAHSMGGLLARTVQLVDATLWNRLMARPGARLLMLGTPNGGSWAPMQVLSGDDNFGNALASFGSPLRDHKAREVMAGMPGFLQLQAGLTDPAQALDKTSTWQKLAADDLAFMQQRSWWHRINDDPSDPGTAAYRWGVPPQPVLDEARQLREQLDKQREAELPKFAGQVLLVLGQAKFTPDGWRIDEREGLVYRAAVDGGDGRVTHASAQLPGVRTWLLAGTEHGSLPGERKAHDAFLELLVHGDTRAPVLQPWGAAATRSGAAAPTAAEVQHVDSRPLRRSGPALPPDAFDEIFSTGVFEPPAAEPEEQPLQVEVLNGNLGFVRQPLIVGHSQTLRLTGTEAAVNALVGGALQAALDTGLYPDAPGSHQVFVNLRRRADNPWAAPQPPAAIVVGLGDESQLNEERLARTVRQGVLAWAQRQAEEGQGLTEGMALAATLMGSGGAGMNASNAARAIAQGVQAANQKLRQRNALHPDDDDWPLVARLTLVELYLERASDAWHGLQVLAEAAPGDYLIAPEIRPGTGALRRQVDSGYRGIDYELIIATGRGDNGIEFRLDTRRARTEVRANSTQRALLRALVAQASHVDNHDPQLGRTLFQLLVPREVEPFLAGSSRMVLELDEQTAPIPWELLDTLPDRAAASAAGAAERRPWAIRTRLLRKLRKVRDDGSTLAVPDAQADDAFLVIGEPLMTDPLYVPLPGAKAEAVAVAEALRQGRAVEERELFTLLDAPAASQVINALFARRYRVVHVAGHGEPPQRQEADPSRYVHKGGVVLSHGAFLGPDEVRAMRTVPELVFVNCCHLAKFQGSEPLEARQRNAYDRTLFASGLADALIDAGVRCVVAAGWAVDDEPAMTFARVFYAELIAGRPFIDAVARAREQTWQQHPDSNTWAAYQCYGDANWTLAYGSGRSQAAFDAVKDEIDSIASPLALVLALEDVIVRMQFMHGDPAAQLERTRRLAARFGLQWGRMGAVAEAFGLACLACGDQTEALRWLSEAVACEDGSAQMRAQEQLGNLRVRRAWEQLEAFAGDAPAEADAVAAATAEITAGLRDLQLLANLLPTAERHNLVGSAWKRLALVAARAGHAAQEQAALENAAAAYARARALITQGAAGKAYYPALNELAIALRLAPGTGPQALPAEVVETARSSLQASIDNAPDFWCYFGLIELDILQAVAGGQLAAEALPLQARLQALHGQVQSLRCWASTADQAALVLQPYAQRLQTPGAPAAEAQAARHLLAQLRRFAGREAAGAAAAG
jgi:hypothetical protein